MAPGSSVVFVDSEGKEHNALVIHEWETCLNIVYVNPLKENEDSFGNERIKETSVPYYEEGMSGFYIKT